MAYTEIATPGSGPAPVLTNVTFDFNSNTINVAFTNTGLSYTTYSVILFENGVPIQAATAGIGQGTLVTTASLQATNRYTVAVMGTGSPNSAYSNMYAVIVNTPVVKKLVLNGDNTATAHWKHVPGYAATVGQTGYYIKLYNSNNKPTKSIIQPTDQLHQTFELPTGYDANGGYITLSLADNGSNSSTSEKFYFNSQQVDQTTMKVYYDGSTIQATWGAPSPAPAKYKVTILSNNDEIASQEVSGLVALFEMALTNLSSYTLIVQPINDAGAYGVPSTPTDILTEKPEITGIYYNGQDLKVFWNKLSEPNIFGFYVIITTAINGNTNVQEVQATSPTKTSTPLTLSPGEFCEVAVQAEGNFTYGMPSDPVSPIQGTPKIASVDYQGNRLKASWSALVDRAPLTYLVAVMDGNTVVDSITTVDSDIEWRTALAPSLTYKLVVTAFRGNASSQPSKGKAIIVDAPEINNVTYDGSIINVGFNPIPNAPAGYAYHIHLYENGKTIQTAKAGANSGSLTPDAPLQMGNAYTVAVRAVSAGTRGPRSSFLEVLQTPPTITKLEINANNTATAHWDASLAYLAPSSTVAYALFLYKADGKPAGLPIMPTDQFQQTFDLPRGYSPDTGYYLQIQMSAGGSMAPMTAPFYLNGEVVSDVQTNNAGNSIVVTWDAATGGERYKVWLCQNGEPIEHQKVSGTAAQFDLFTNEANTYEVMVQSVNTDNAYGPLSPAAEVVTQHAEIIQTVYDGTKLVVTFDEIDDPHITGYHLLLTQNTTNGLTTTTKTVTKSPASMAMDDTNYNTIAIQAVNGNNAGPISESLEPITGIPSMVQAHYNGQELQLEWTAVSGAEGYIVLVAENGGGVSTYTTDSTRLVLDALNVTAAYTVQLFATNSRSIGPAHGKTNLLLQAPSLTGVSYDGTTINASFDKSGMPSGTSYTLLLLKDGEVIQTNGAGNGSGTLTPQNAFQPNSLYSIAVQANKGVVYGPLSTSSNLLTVPPTITKLVINNDNTATAHWESALSYLAPGDATYALFLYKANGRPAGIPPMPTNGFEQTFNLPGNYKPGNGYYLQLQMSASGSSAPLTPKFYLNSEVVTNVQTTNSGQAITATWNAATGTDRYKAWLYLDGTPIAHQKVQGTTAQFDAATNAGQYQVLVQAIDDSHSFGPLSAPANVVTQTPAIVEVRYDGNALTVSYDEVSSDAVDGYQLVVTQNTTNGLETTLHSVASSPASVPFASSNYGTVAIQALAGNNTGPVSETITPIADAPTILQANYDGGELAMEWTAVHGDDVGYTVMVSENGGSPTHYDTIGTSLKINQLNPANTYDLQVYAHSDRVMGPPDNKVTALLAAPVLSNVTYDGTVINATFNVSNMPSGCSYALLLLKDNVVIQTNRAGNGTGSLTPQNYLQPGSVYSIAVQATNGVTQGPWSNNNNLTINPPTIEKVVVDGNMVTAYWSVPKDFYPSSGTVYQLICYNSNNRPTKPIMPTNALQQTFKLPNNAAYVTVQASDPASQGPVSQPFHINTHTIDQLTAHYTNQLVTIGWQAETGADFYEVSIFEQDALLSTQIAYSESALVEVPLDEWRQYNARVRSVDGQAYGPLSGPVDILTDVPNITIADYTGNQFAGKIEVHWDAVNNYKGNYSVQLLDGNTELQTLTNQSSPATLVLAGAEAWRKYKVRVMAQSAENSSRWSRKTNVVTATPENVKVVNQGTALDVSWDPVLQSWITGYEVSLLENGAASTNYPPVYAETNHATLPYAVPTTSNDFTVVVQALSDVAAGPTSTPVGVLTMTTSIITTAYNGSLVTATWKSTSADSYIMGIYEDDTLLKSINTYNTSGSIEIALNPNDQIKYLVKVQAVVGTAVGMPDDGMYIIQTAPTVTEVDINHADNAVTVQWNEISNVQGYYANLYEGDTYLTGNQLTDKSDTTTTIDYDFEPWRSYNIKIYGYTAAGESTGPSTVLSGLVTAAPVVEEVYYNNTNVLVKWKPLQNADITGYLVTLLEDGDPVTAYPPMHVVNDEVTINAPGLTGNNYSVIVQTTSAAGEGPASAPEPIITESTTLETASYNGSSVTASWDSETGADTYTMVIYDGPTIIASQEVNGTTGTISIQLEADNVYHVFVSLNSGISYGPKSNSITLLDEAPVIQNVVVTDPLHNQALLPNIALTWSTVKGATDYIIQLYDGNTVVHTETVKGGDVYQYDFNYALVAWKSYTINLYAKTKDNRGPEGDKVTVISAAPTITEVDYDGERIAISWDALNEEGVTGYLVSLMEDGETSTNYPPVYTTGTYMEIDIEMTYFDLYVVVNAVGSKTEGPASIPVSSIIDTVTIDSVSYDKVTTHATWNTDDTDDSYEMGIYDGSTLISSVEVEDASGTIIMPLGSGDYDVRVRLVEGVSKGPLSDPEQIVTEQPVVIHVDNATTLTENDVPASNALTVRWNPLDTTGVKVYKIDIYTGPKMVLSQPVTGNTYHQSFNLPMAGWESYDAVVYAKSGQSEGPPSEAVTLVPMAPVIEHISYDGNNTVVEWAPTDQGLATGYRVVLEENGAELTAFPPIHTNDTTATFEGTLNGSTTITVQAFNDVVEGPRSVPVAVPLGTPGITELSNNNNVVKVTCKEISDSATTHLVVNLYREDILWQSNTIPNPSMVENVEFAVNSNAGVTYRVTIAPANAIATGKETTFALPNVDPVFTKIWYKNATTVYVEWTNLTPPSGIHYLNEPVVANPLTGEQYKTPTKDQSSTTIRIPSNKAPLQGWQTFEATLERQVVGSYGPLHQIPTTSPLPVITAVPVVENLSYANKTIEASWSNLLEQGITGYRVMIYKTTVDINSAPWYETHVTTNSVTIDKNLTGSDPYFFLVSAVGDISEGRATEAITVVTDKPTIDSVYYDGELITVNWSNNHTGIESCVVELYEDGVLVQSADAGITNTSLEATLDPALSYTVAVRYVEEGVVVGPSSNAVPVHTQAPVITGTSYSNGTIYVSAQHLGTFAKLALYEGGTLLQTFTTAGTSQGKKTFNYALDEFGTYSVVIYGKLLKSYSPASNQAAVIAAVPTIESINYNGQQTEVTWGAMNANVVNGFVVEMWVNNESVTNFPPISTFNNSLIIPGVLNTTDTFKVSVYGVNGVAVGPTSARATILTSTENVKSVSYSANNLVIDLNNSGNYLAELYADQTLLQSIAFNNNKVVMDVVLAAEGAYTVGVRKINGAATGPVGNTIEVITQAPVIQSVVYDNEQTDPTVALTWSAPGQSTGDTYTAILYQDDPTHPIAQQAQVGDTTTTLTFTATPAHDKQYFVAVWADSDSQTGPSSPPVEVVVSDVNITDVYYDGAQVSAAWDVLMGSGITGYQVDLWAEGNTHALASTTTNSNNATLIATLANNTNYEVTVTPISNSSQGTASTPASVPLQGYYFSDVSESNTPYLLRSEKIPAVPNAKPAIALWLPNLFTTLPEGITLPASIDPNAAGVPFGIEKTGNATLPYQLKAVANSAIWTFGSDNIRAAIKTQFQTMMNALEGLGLLPGAWWEVQQTFVQGMPLTFDETLYYAYGFDPINRSVNLQPGMRVTFDFEAHQFVGSEDTDLNGFVGGGASQYNLGSYHYTIQGNEYLETGFSNFLSQLPIEVDNNVGGGGGAIDMYANGFRKPYYKLLYPTTINSSDGNGSSNASTNVSILAADTMANLETYAQSRNFNTLPATVALTFFRGRVVITPEVRVLVNGAPTYVPVGSSVRQLVEQFTSLPYTKGLADQTTAGYGSAGIVVTNIAYKRSTGKVVTAPFAAGATYTFGQSAPVQFSYQQLVEYENGSDFFDLPVLHGDTLTFNS